MRSIIAGSHSRLRFRSPVRPRVAYPEPPAARSASGSDGAAADWPDAESWLRDLFPSYVEHPFADRHRELWDWGWSVELGKPCDAFVACWGRGGAKSTSAELLVVRWGAARRRRYGLYVCATQQQADDHVGNIANMLESEAIERHYPEMGERLLGKFGASKGWRRNRLRTSSGFTVDALGLDTAARGVKLDEMRPDFLIIDDIDDTEDSEAVTAKKQRFLTRKLLPALTHDAAILFIQNKVHDDSLMAQLLDGRADMLGGARISGPHPAIEGLTYEGEGTDAIITGGTATWEGQSLADCQRFIQKWGLDAFLSECQHQSVGQRGRYLSSIGLWDACLDPDLPPLTPHEPLIFVADAGESNDTFATLAIGRHPADAARLAVRYSRVYVPEAEGVPLDFDQIEGDILDFCQRHAVVELAYDRMLMGQIIRRLAPRLPCPAVIFSQGGDRLEADKASRDLIMARRIAHDGSHGDLRAHLDNANAKVSADGRQVRIVKRSKTKKIDAAVCLAMGAYRALLVLPEVNWLVFGEV